ncbi:MAG: FeoB-associated Cys-rich membrane protein [Ruminococcaceae bacterium]|nr:FeoB-associated Cys-rich membrane protein [Oscillospiraceae bacterium]
MTGADWIIVGVIAVIVGGAMAYIIHAKKSGKKCIGCPDSCSCQKGREPKDGGCGNCGGGCHCREE